MAREVLASCALLRPFVDVDDLKNTNDSLAHVAGDRLLRQATDSIRRRLGSYDLIIRYGSVGLAELGVDDPCEDFSARADKAMYSTRKRSRWPQA